MLKPLSVAWAFLARCRCLIWQQAPRSWKALKGFYFFNISFDKKRPAPYFRRMPRQQPQFSTYYKPLRPHIIRVTGIRPNLTVPRQASTMTTSAGTTRVMDGSSARTHCQAIVISHRPSTRTCTWSISPQGSPTPRVPISTHRVPKPSCGKH